MAADSLVDVLLWELSTRALEEDHPHAQVRYPPALVFNTLRQHGDILTQRLSVDGSQAHAQTWVQEAPWESAWTRGGQTQTQLDAIFDAVRVPRSGGDGHGARDRRASTRTSSYSQHSPGTLPTRVSVSTGSYPRAQSMATPQTARGWVCPPPRHFENQPCCCCQTQAWLCCKVRAGESTG
jgi:hypothetical protein